MSKRIVVGITGASGSVYARVLLEKLLTIKSQWEKVAVVMSDNARTVWKYELGDASYESYPFDYYTKTDFEAPFASGSGRYDTVILIPCSMGMLGRIAHGISDDLPTRAADVALKERRRLIVVPRETPYNLIHLENMVRLAQAGAIICPASPSFYSRPAGFDELAATVVDRVLHLAGFSLDSYQWGEGA